jgi:hypothetical protein
MRALRFQNLVYVPLPKHASTSYRWFFGQHLGWKDIPIQEIDWVNDTVFAHLLDPITRHINGIAQILSERYLAHLMGSPDFIELLRTSIFPDQHTYPITRMLDISQCYKMEWLLLDHSKVPGEELTCAFLKEHDIHVEPGDIPKMNCSDEYKSKLRQSLLVDIEQALNSLIYVLQEDLNLYNTVKSHTRFSELNHLPWNEISYKKNFVEHHGFENLLSTRFNRQPININRVVHLRA